MSDIDYSDLNKFEDDNFSVEVVHESDRHRETWALRETHNGYQYFGITFHSISEMQIAINALQKAIEENTHEQ